ncbi:hypothetical protein CW745_10440 [Psychromonas sp. psych-6C06]|uniref:CDP-glycerol glycerophosphotransferase family protein n=1 Tax=Psychromonas sp. psych-6C06 TaxID=2058089 RepID=UPI000C3499C7|nr:CDP-glycerol glycerophosphotransferase family protein [Psychromonas sp. psych-6C06]PKF61728.1 hypothetical protein CW745_10440 [Psychromonas sp. psych-6C06]
MNKHKYSLLKLFHFLSGFFLSWIYAFFLLKRDKRIVFSSTNNEHFIFNSKSLFIDQKAEFESAGFQVFFVMNDPVKRKLLNKQFPNAFISNKGIKNKLFILKSAVWVISTLDLPVSGLFLSRNRFVYQLGHGTPIKNIGLMEAKCSLVKKLYYKANATNISLFLSPSKFFQSYIADAFGVNINKVVVAPQPRNDALLAGGQPLMTLRDDVNSKLILYCPTWRPFSNLRLFPFERVDLSLLNSYLKEKNCKLLLRLHPLFEGDLSQYERSNIVIFDSNICPEISDVLVDIDALITDYSSIYCDYYLLDRPVAFIPYDLSIYTQKIGFSFDYKELTSNCYLENLSQFQLFVSEVAQSSFDITEQIRIKHRLNVIAEQSAGSFNYDLILKKYGELE